MSFARGFIKGFIGQSLDNKAAADQRLAELTDRISVDYLNNKLPAFLENEKNMQKRYNLIEKNMGKNSALYASAQGLTETDAGMNMLLGLKDEERSSFLEAVNKIDFMNYNRDMNAQTRTADFTERHAETTNYLKTIPGRLPPSVADLMIPKPSGDMPQSQFDATTLQPLDTMIGSTAGNVYNIKGLDKNDPVYPIIRDLLSDYDDAVKRGYTGGELKYARDKFINQELSKQGITNYPRSGYDDLPEAKTVAKEITPDIPGANKQTENLITKRKTKKFDPEKSPGKRYDPEKSPGKRYDPKKSPGIRVTDESGAIMNEARQAISSISRSTTLSDEQKEEAIANVRAAAKEEIKKIGLDPDNFSF